MFQFISIFGPAAITCLIVQKCSKKVPENWYVALLELISYATLNAAVTFCCLAPFGLVKLSILESGVKEFRYSAIAFLFALAVSVLLGVVFAIVKTQWDFHIEIEAREEKRGKRK